MMTVSIIIPAYNEEAYLAATLVAVAEAIEHATTTGDCATEVIVVDNGSTDRTAEIAKASCIQVVHEPRSNVAVARNAGAGVATGQTLVFLDADTIWPVSVLSRIIETMSVPECVGGAVDTDYRPKRAIIRAYLRFWRIIGRLTGMAQGATQFCDRDLFAALGGYDQNVFMGEDVDFFWRIKKAAARDGKTTKLIDDVKVRPSCRRFDQWSIWKTLVLTNPLTCALYSRRSGPWKDWYGTPPR